MYVKGSVVGLEFILCMLSIMVRLVNREDKDFIVRVWNKYVMSC